eukprot:392689-Amphidinium_carterae.1
MLGAEGHGAGLVDMCGLWPLGLTDHSACRKHKDENGALCMARDTTRDWLTALRRVRVHSCWVTFCQGFHPKTAKCSANRTTSSSGLHCLWHPNLRWHVGWGEKSRSILLSVLLPGAVEASSDGSESRLSGQQCLH